MTPTTPGAISPALQSQPVEAGSASDPVTIRAKIAADIREVRDEMRSRGVSATDGAVTLGCIVAKHEAEILAALASPSPAAVPESVRRAFADYEALPASAMRWECERVAFDYVRALLADAPPSGRAGEEIDAPAGARVVEEALAEFQRRNGYHKPEIEELLTEFGELLLTKVAAPAPASAGAVPEGWRKVLRDLLNEHDKHVCHHEETHRGGVIWTICDHCGRKWADDEGGFQPYEEPPAVTAAWSLLKCEEVAAPAAPETPTKAPAHGIAEGGWCFDMEAAPKDEEIILQTRGGMYIAQWFSRARVSDHEGWHVHDGYQWHVIQGDAAECWIPRLHRATPPATPAEGRR